MRGISSSYRPLYRPHASALSSSQLSLHRQIHERRCLMKSADQQSAATSFDGVSSPTSGSYYWELLNNPEQNETVFGHRARSATDANVLRRKGHLKVKVKASNYCDISIACEEDLPSPPFLGFLGAGGFEGLVNAPICWLSSTSTSSGSSSSCSSLRQKP